MVRYLAVDKPTEILEEYRYMNEEEFKRNYKIYLNDDGTVFDKVNKKCYSTLSHWAISLKGDTNEN